MVSVGSFVVAWQEREYFIVHNLDLTYALIYAQLNDLDMLGRKLLVTMLEMDGATPWFHVRGAIL